MEKKRSLLYRVIAASAPGMATQYALQRHPAAFEGAILINGVYSILRTRRRVATGWLQQWRNAILIKANDRQWYKLQ
jgi:pimeloyl-ACP methyl ester carboxylesterase